MRFEATNTGGGNFAALVPIEIELLALDAGDGTHPVKTVQAVADSGASLTSFPASMLPPGLTYDDLPEWPHGAVTARGIRKPHWMPANLTFNGRKFGEALIVDPPIDSPLPILLGRMDFFRTFKVEFQFYRDPPVFYVKTP